LNYFTDGDFEELQKDLYEKKSSSEKARGKRNISLENFIDMRMTILDGERESLERKSFSWEKLNQLFLDIAGGNYA
jgi:hypothetical protein